SMLTVAASGILAARGRQAASVRHRPVARARRVAQIDVDRKSGAINVKRLVAAQDMGIVINPDDAKMQMEGCMTQGLGYVLSEELQFKGGDILDRNFDTYELPRFAILPRIETVLIKNDDLTPAGGGEPG